MRDLRRHAPVGRYRAPRLRDRRSVLPLVARGRARRLVVDVFDRDHPRRGAGHTLKWLLSTMLAGAVGLAAIAVVIYGALDVGKPGQDLLTQIEETARLAPQRTGRTRNDGLNWAMPKGDRLQIASGAITERHIIHEQIQIRRNGKPYLWIRPYMRVVARLAPVSGRNTDVIPAFNPFQLYANSGEERGDGGHAGVEGAGQVAVKVIELIGDLLPAEDGLELDAQEALEIVQRTNASGQDDGNAVGSGLGLSNDITQGLTPAYLRNSRDGLGDIAALTSNMTVLRKSSTENDDSDEVIEGAETRVVRAAKGDTLAAILQRNGAESWLVRLMLEPAKDKRIDLAIGDEVHITLAPNPSDPDKLEPSRFSLFGSAHQHRMTIERAPDGTFVARDTPISPTAARALKADNGELQATSVYASLYNAALMQGLEPDRIQQILRVHAYQTDFRRRVRAGDQIELFFDMKEEKQGEAIAGELLYTAISSGGDAQRYWRYRTPDGAVDYYDERGQNAKQFLMRKPVRSDDVRLTSGFGMRYHPLLNARRMHTGIDWAGPPGTPILASGNGVIEELRRRVTYGNHIRIKHANGYQTTYSHMRSFAPGIKEGSKVRQGQVIGYLGSTGLSSGPHLHFEVLVSNRYVDPLRLQVPRERRLAGKDLGEFEKERSRINDLMRRAPVKIDNR